MFCTSCGRALPNGAAHCPDCGAEAKPIDYCGGFAGITEPPGPEPQPPKNDRRERRLLGVIIALSILLLLSAAGTLYLLGHGGSEAPQTPAQTEAVQRTALTRTGANP